MPPDVPPSPCKLILGLMFPHLLHLVHLSNPDELHLHLKLILGSHDQLCLTGASIPSEAMMEFPHVSDYPSVSKKFIRLRRKFFQDLSFPIKNFDFHPPKFLMTIFKSSTKNFEIHPLFSFFQSNSPLFRQNLSFLLLCQISPDFFKISGFCTCFL